MKRSNANTLAEEVAVVLRQAIADGTYLSGERLVELAIAQEFSVSQNTVRDALRLLENEGWIVKTSRRGAFVRTFSSEEAAEVYALLEAVGGLALRRATARISQQEIQHLRDMLADARTHAQNSYFTAATEMLYRLQDEIARIAGGTQTAALLHQLHNQMRILDGIRRANAPAVLQVQLRHLEAHAALVEALAQDNTEAAARAFHGFVEQEAAALLRVLVD